MPWPQQPSMRPATSNERALDRIRAMMLGRPEEAPAPEAETAIQPTTLWDKIKEFGSSLTEQPVARVAGMVGDITDEGFRGQTRDEPGWAFAGVPFGPNQTVYHGTQAPIYRKMNSAYNNKSDLFGEMTHFAENPEYAGQAFAGVQSSAPVVNFHQAMDALEMAGKYPYSNTVSAKELQSVLDQGWNIYNKPSMLWDSPEATAWFKSVQPYSDLVNPTPIVPRARSIPAKLDVKNAIDVYTWPPSQMQIDDLLKVGAINEATHASYIQQLPWWSDAALQRVETLISKGQQAKKILRQPLERRLKEDPMALSRSGFDGVKYGDNMGAQFNEGASAPVWAVENPAQAKSPFTGEALGVNIKPKNLHRMQDTRATADTDLLDIARELDKPNRLSRVRDLVNPKPYPTNAIIQDATDAFQKLGGDAATDFQGWKAFLIDYLQKTTGWKP